MLRLLWVIQFPNQYLNISMWLHYTQLPTPTFHWFPVRLPHLDTISTSEAEDWIHDPIKRYHRISTGFMTQQTLNRPAAPNPPFSLQPQHH